MSNSEREELIAKICPVFDVFPEEIKYDLKDGIGTKRMNKLLDVIETYVESRERQARIDEVKNTVAELKTDQDSGLDIVYITFHGKLYAKRLAELQSTQKENK